MKDKHRYHMWDIINLAIFYSIFTTFIVSCIMGVVKGVNGELTIDRVIYRFALTILMCTPFAIKKVFKISFSRLVSTLFYLYMFLAGFLGGIINFYQRFFWWDILIHFIMGMVVAVLSIYILNFTIYRKDRAKHNLFFTFLFMISFAMAIGAVWEIWEFAGDVLFKLNAQNHIGEIGLVALRDTMVDLCMDFIGAICGVIFTAVVLKINKKFLKSFYIKKLKNKEQEIESIEE